MKIMINMNICADGSGTRILLDDNEITNFFDYEVEPCTKGTSKVTLKFQAFVNKQDGEPNVHK